MDFLGNPPEVFILASPLFFLAIPNGRSVEMAHDNDPRLAKSRKAAEQAIQLHRQYRGKIQIIPKCPIREFSDFSIWYTPGVAEPCRAIVKEKSRVYDFTNKGNSIAIVTDGTRVLGLGDIGPEAGLPVMEGKALLFKYLGGVDAVPICLGTTHPDEFIQTVKHLQPTFGGINLEDISQPKCFKILDQLRKEMDIPVWHDDQQGSGTALLAGLLNALRIVQKDLATIRVAMIGMGAANVAVYRLLKHSGLDPGRVIACDRQGTLHRHRRDIEARQDEFVDKWRVCQETNATGLQGTIAEALRGADVCVAFAGPQVVQAQWISTMAPNAVVFACANPTPEIWPWEAKEAGARIVATGRGDFPNQVNNSLVFPGVFRGALDVRASTITDEMALAAAHALADYAVNQGIHDDAILPTMAQWDVYPQVAVATALQAQAQGLAGLHTPAAQLHADATRIIRQAREATQLLMPIMDAPFRSQEGSRT